ncbi:MAG: hypothetical protein O2924_05055 [Chloroflexi bacterium]|nr:hypothetical protein [Chloroflexota bacterium]
MSATRSTVTTVMSSPGATTMPDGMFRRALPTVVDQIGSPSGVSRVT